MDIRCKVHNLIEIVCTEEKNTKKLCDLHPRYSVYEQWDRSMGVQMYAFATPYTTQDSE
jgi:hypothetical protein